jgi:hypothetical protein
MSLLRHVVVIVLILTVALPAAAQWPRSVFVELASATW